MLIFCVELFSEAPFWGSKPQNAFCVIGLFIMCCGLVKRVYWRAKRQNMYLRL